MPSDDDEFNQAIAALAGIVIEGTPPPMAAVVEDMVRRARW